MTPIRTKKGKSPTVVNSINYIVICVS